MLVGLRAEAVKLARTNPRRLDRAGCEVADLVQSGALGYLRALDRVTPATKNPHAFAMAAARGAMLDVLRDGEPPADAPHVSLDHATDTATPERAAGSRKDGLLAMPRRVRRAVAQLPEKQQQTLRLTLQGRGPQEIARIVGVSENAIALRKHQAVKRLRDKLAA